MLKLMQINDQCARNWRCTSLGGEQEGPISGPYTSGEAGLVGIEARGMGEDATTGRGRSSRDETWPMRYGQGGRRRPNSFVVPGILNPGFQRN